MERNTCIIGKLDRNRFRVMRYFDTVDIMNIVGITTVALYAAAHLQRKKKGNEKKEQK